MTRPLRAAGAIAVWAALSAAPGPSFAQTPAPADPHAGHRQDPPAAHPHEAPGAPETPAATGDQDLPPFIPVPTDADRAAAFPDVHAHRMHDNAINWQVLFDQLEWQQGGRTDDVSWDTTSWLGTDIHRVWFRAEGDRAQGRFEQAQLQLLYGRAMSRWWQAVAGVRQDVRPGSPRTAAALGIVGLAPYWFHVEASLFAEANGRAHLRLETEYELLVTNRLVLQPLAEAEIYTRPDREQQLGRGLATLNAGVRLRYEIRREFAPYVGVVWHRTFFETSTLHRAAGRRDQGVAAVVGVRVWR